MAQAERGGDTLGVAKGPAVLHMGLNSIHGRLSPSAPGVPPQIDGQHPARTRQGWSNQVKPMAIGATTMYTHQRVRSRTAVVQVVQVHVFQLQAFTATVGRHASSQGTASRKCCA